MSWARFALRHPVPAIVFFLVALVVGAVSLTRLAVDLYPAMEFPIAVVLAEYEGAGPQEVESLVSRPLEEAMGTVPGVSRVRSQSNEGLSLVIAEFRWGTDMDQATLEMREKVDLAKPVLPDEAKRFRVFKIDIQAMPVLVLGLTGGQDEADLKRVAEGLIKPRLERLAGVASVNVSGGVEREIQVVAEPGRLQNAGLSVAQLVQALRGDNLNLPGGEVQEGSYSLLVRSTGQFRTLEDIRDLRISGPRGLVRLGDVAEVRDTYADRSSKVWVNAAPGVAVEVQKQSGSNTVQVARVVKAELAKLEQELPGAVRAHILSDQSAFVMRSMEGVITSATQGGLLAILVLYLFLRNFRATLAVGLAIPISIITTFGVLFFAGVTMNMMSMGGLALGVGMLVDNAIVVLENVFRHHQQGKPPDEAALVGTGEVALAVAASTMTTIAVFLPVVFITGLAQQYFRQLALSVTFSLLSSLAVSLTLVPLMAARLLAAGPAGAGPRTGAARAAARFMAAVGRGWDSLAGQYSRLLGWALRRRGAVVAGALAAVAVAAGLSPLMGTAFIPEMDTSQFRVTVELPNGTRLDQSEAVARAVEERVAAIPEVHTVYTSVGTTGGLFMGGRSGSHLTAVNALLARPGNRDRSLVQIMDEVRTSLLVPGARVSVEPAGSINPGGAPIEIRIKGDDLEVLRNLADQVAAELRRVPGTREVRSSAGDGLPEVQVVVDRARAGQAGLTPTQVAMAVRSAVQGQVATRYRVGGEEYDIRVQAGSAVRESLEALEQLLIPSPAGLQVPLHEVATLVRATGPASVVRDGQARVVSVNAQLFDRDLGSVMDDVQARVNRLALPPGYFIEYGGQNAEMVAAFGGLLQALALSVVLVYLVMAAQFESFVHPFTIMLAVPLAFVGAITAMVVTGRNMDISGMLGVIMLVGIVVNNAIVLVDYTNKLRGRGLGVREALLQAGPTRLRPVLMTTLTTVLGLAPMALGLIEGSDLQAPMATVVIGGLTFSTLLTLLVIPVGYSLVEDALHGDWLRRLRRGSRPAQAAD